MEAAGGVDDERVDVARGGRLQRVEHDGGGIRAGRLANDVHADPRSPRLELLDRRGPKRVGGCQQHLLAVAAQLRGQLRAGRRLARAVDAEHQDDGRPMVEIEGLGRRCQHFGEKSAEERSELLGSRHRAEHDLLARAVDEVGGERGAQIGRDQRLLQLRVERFVDRTIGLENGLELGAEELSRAPEACA